MKLVVTQSSRREAIIRLALILNKRLVFTRFIERGFI